MTNQPASRWAWLNATILGIVLATFFSDLSHELATAVLPLYLKSLLLGAAALGLIEGVADFLVSVSKLGGGIVGHHVRNKPLWCSLGYLVTALATAAMGLVEGVWALLALRGVAWMARGFRSPLRDTLLAENVEQRYYGRAFGLERAGDMLGAVGGQVLAIVLIWTASGTGLGQIILWSFLPGILAAASIFFFTHDAPGSALDSAPPVPLREVRFQPAFWWFLVGVFFFGLGDFSRTFFILLTANVLGEEHSKVALTISVVLYLVHNLVSALAAYPVGSWADRWAKQPVLLLGYILGVLTNVLLAVAYGWLAGLVVAVILSGIYIAVVEAVEKATAAELLTPANRSLGFGILACVNAVGDMVSSISVGLLLDAGQGALAFSLAAAVGFVGVLWLFVFRARMRPSLAGVTL
jgi:MFS family permease